MAIVGRFGSLYLDEFNEPWEEENLPPGVLTKVFELVVPVGPAAKIFVVCGAYVSGPSNCLAELRKAGSLLWRGQSTPSSGDIAPPSWYPGGHQFAPGETVEMWVEHYHSAPLTFAGNVYGYKKKA